MRDGTRPVSVDTGCSRCCFALQPEVLVPDLRVKRLKDRAAAGWWKQGARETICVDQACTLPPRRYTESDGARQVVALLEGQGREEVGRKHEATYN